MDTKPIIIWPIGLEGTGHHFYKTFKMSTKVIDDENLKIINNTLQNLNL